MPPARKSRRLSGSKSDLMLDQKKTRSSREISSPAGKDVKPTKSPRSSASEMSVVSPNRPGRGLSVSKSDVDTTFEEEPPRGSPRTSGRISKPTPKVSVQLKSPHKQKNVTEKKEHSGPRASPRSAQSIGKQTSDCETKVVASSNNSVKKGQTTSGGKSETTEKDVFSKNSKPTEASTPRSRGRPRKFTNSKPVDSTGESSKTSGTGNKDKEVQKDIEVQKDENKSDTVSGEDSNDEFRAHVGEPKPDTTDKKVNSDLAEKQTSSVEELVQTSNSDGLNREEVQKTSNTDNVEIHVDQGKTESTKERFPTKRRAGQDDLQQPSAKKSKESDELEIVSPRKSSRHRKLSRWFEDMEVEFGKKKTPEVKAKKQTIPKKAVKSSVSADVASALTGKPEKSCSQGVKVPENERETLTDLPKVPEEEKQTRSPHAHFSLAKPLLSKSSPLQAHPAQTAGPPAQTAGPRAQTAGPMAQTAGSPPKSSDESTQVDIPESEADESDPSLHGQSDACLQPDTNKDTEDNTEYRFQEKYIIPLMPTEDAQESTQASQTDENAKSQKEPKEENATEGTVITVHAQSKPDESIPDTYRNLTYTSIVLPADPTTSADTQQTVSVDVQTEGDPDPNKASQKKQEFVIVRLPEGVAIQQEVSTRKPADVEGVQCSVNEADGTLKCMDCNYITNKKPNWYKHKKMHMGVKPYVCDICQYRASTSSNLKRHKNIHNDVRTHACDRCGLTFRQKIHLERHIKYKHEEKSIQCPLCDYVCANENPDLKIHIKRRHQRPPDMNPDGGFTCEECGLVAISRRDYKQHMKFHKRGPELKLFCEHCSFVTDCESRMNRHLMSHTKVKPFQCGLCDYKGTQKEHVVRHMKTQHNVEMPEKGVQRIQREKQSITEEALAAMGVTEEDSLSNPPTPGGADSDKKADKADFSSRDKIFACNHCTMKFAKLINLYKHLHTQHRAIMPTTTEEFSCVVCEFRTNSKKNLLVHMRKHNLLDQSPPSHVYSCVLCSYVNPKRRNLFQHMKKKHKIEIVMKDDGSANCFIAENSNLAGGSGEVSNENLMTVGDVVTASTSDAQLQVVTENRASGTVQRLVSISDLTNAISLPQNTDGVVYIDSGVGSKAVTQMDLADLQVESINVQHEAAEAIQGLQALAEQRHILETPINVSIDHLQSSVTDTGPLEEQVEFGEQVLTEQVEEEEVSTPVLEVGHPVAAIDTECAVEGNVTEGDSIATEERPSIQLSSDQLMNLSSGDYVEINGEMYKVEFTTEEAPS